MAAGLRTPHRVAFAQVRAEAHAAPVVLVPRDQEVLLASYAQQWRTHRYVRVTAQVIPKPPLEPLEIAPIQIDALDVQLLTDSGS